MLDEVGDDEGRLAIEYIIQWAETEDFDKGQVIKVIDELVYDGILMWELDGHIEWYDIEADIEDEREYGEIMEERKNGSERKTKKGKRGKRKDKKTSSKKSRKTGVDA